MSLTCLRRFFVAHRTILRTSRSFRSRASRTAGAKVPATESTHLEKDQVTVKLRAQGSTKARGGLGGHHEKSPYVKNPDEKVQREK